MFDFLLEKNECGFITFNFFRHPNHYNHERLQTPKGENALENDGDDVMRK